jgi:hypothetical protein
MAKKTVEAETSRDEMANLILSLSYGELLRVGDALADAKGQKLETGADFAKLLYDWAEAQ